VKIKPSTIRAAVSSLCEAGLDGTVRVEGAPVLDSATSRIDPYTFQVRVYDPAGPLERTFRITVKDVT
jgi:hypothetical protein